MQNRVKCCIYLIQSRTKVKKIIKIFKCVSQAILARKQIVKKSNYQQWKII